MPPEVARALCGHVAEYTAYPDPLCRALRAALERHHRIPAGYFLCGNGAADLIFRLAFALRPQKALIPAPTFAEYAQALEQAGCPQVERHFLSPQRDFALEEDFLEAVTPGTQLVFLCNPNNPTGLVTPSRLLLRLVERCEEVGARLCLDECFLDFLPEQEQLTLFPLLEKHPSLLILRAFTKLYAMAGIRLGYLACSDGALLERLREAGQPWSVSTVASVCGAAALECEDFRRRTLETVPRNREALKAGLEALGLRVLPGRANYLCFSTSQPELGEKLEKQGILIRDCRNYPGLCPGWFRVAVRTQVENQRLLQAMGRILLPQEERP